MSRVCQKTLSAYKSDLIDVYKNAIDAVKPDHLVKSAIKFEKQSLVVNSSSLDGSPSASVHNIKNDLSDLNLHVVGGGKCVLAMARGLAEVASQAQLTERFSHGCLSLPFGQQAEFEQDLRTKSLLESIKISCRFGAKNNLPDENSVAGSEFLLDQVGLAAAKDKAEQRRSLFIVLISGGGSACLTSPKHVSLSEKLTLTRRLVESGADIVELNNVRRCLSDIKNGQLARHILESNPNSRIISLILSDTIGDRVESIASGPTHLSNRNDCWETMLDILNKYDLIKSYPHLLKNPGDTPVGLVEEPSTVQNIVIANNGTALESAISRARELGYQVQSLGNGLCGPTEMIVNQLLSRGGRDSRTFAKLLIVGGGEATVRKNPGENWGTGGRVQEMALDYLISRLSERPEASTSEFDYFLAGSTDGQDGPTDVAACVASYAEWKLNSDRQSLPGLEEAKLAKSYHDSYNFWTNCQPDWLIKTGLTGTNVMDIFLYLVVEQKR